MFGHMYATTLYITLSASACIIVSLLQPIYIHFTYKTHFVPSSHNFVFCGNLISHFLLNLWARRICLKKQIINGYRFGHMTDHNIIDKIQQI